MARPRSFDGDAILDKTVEVFRSKGFEGASVSDLEKATGLRRASLYGAFGDKRALYLAALRRYDSTRASLLMAEIAAAPTGRKALERLFSAVVKEAVSDPCGCLLANAASENASRDARVSRCVEDGRRRVEGGLHAALLRGRADGSVKASGDPRALARFLYAAVLGLRALAKSGAPESDLRGVAETALKSLG